MKSETTATETVTCPRGAILDAWSDTEWNDGVQIDQMKELTMLAVHTRNYDPATGEKEILFGHRIITTSPIQSIGVVL